MQTLSIIHGIFFIAAGLWPVVHIESFMKVTGPKIDIWLVKAVGLLLVSIGLVLFCAGYNHEITKEIVLLGILSPCSLAVIGIIYASIGRISRVYLLDAFVHSIFALSWIMMNIASIK